MQLNAISRKSAVVALSLLVVMLVAAALRRVFAPFEIELAFGESSEKLYSFIAGFLLFVGVAVVEGRMLLRTGLSNGYSTFPIPLYAVVACGVVVASNVLMSALVSLCFVLTLMLFLRSLVSVGEKDSIFFAALLLAVMALIYPPAIVFAGLLPISIFILGLSLRQVICMIVGYILPLFGASYVSWYAGNEFWAFSRTMFGGLVEPSMEPISEIPYLAMAMVVVIVVLLIWGLVYVMLHPEKTSRLTRVRRALHLFVWATIVGLSMLLIPSSNLTMFAIFAVPVAILLSFFLGVLPNNYATIAYWVLLALFAVHLFIA